MSHIPVLLQEVIGILKLQEGQFMIDGTVGSGGHAKEIVARLGPSGTFLGVDRDAEAARRAKSVLERETIRRLVVVQGNYAALSEILANEKLPRADSLLLDLGLSSDQLAASGRGFSFEGDEPLDMRYDPQMETPSAADVVNGMRAEELADVLFRYGEERRSREIAAAIVAARRQKKLLRTSDLVSVITSVVPRHSRTHPATKTFMALRIFVNRELEHLETILADLPHIVRIGGTIAIITFHSLEDRIVKNRFRELARAGHATLLTKKPIIPTREEILQNPRSRSAKLRAIQIL